MATAIEHIRMHIERFLDGTYGGFNQNFESEDENAIYYLTHWVSGRDRLQVGVLVKNGAEEEYINTLKSVLDEYEFTMESEFSEEQDDYADIVDGVKYTAVYKNPLSQSS